MNTKLPRVERSKWQNSKSFCFTKLICWAGECKMLFGVCVISSSSEWIDLILPLRYCTLLVWLFEKGFFHFRSKCFLLISFVMLFSLYYYILIILFSQNDWIVKFQSKITLILRLFKRILEDFNYFHSDFKQNHVFSKKINSKW